MGKLSRSWECAVALGCLAWMSACGSDTAPKDDSPSLPVAPPSLSGAAGRMGVSAAGTTGVISTPSSGLAGSPSAPAAGGAAGRGGALPPAGMPQQPPASGNNPPMTPAMMPPAMTPPAMPAMRPWNTSGKTCLQAGNGKYGEPGPYMVGRMDVDLGMIQEKQGTGKFTIFYPMPLEASCQHPIVAWGNGTGVTGADTYAFFNQNAASWGMVVIASHESNTGSGEFHKKALDYLLKENESEGSRFFKKLSPRAGTSGHSQGAFGATAAANHPNVTVEVAVGGGGSTAAKMAMLCLTGTEDIVATSCPASIDRAGGPAFAASWEGGDHVGTQTVAGYIGRDPGTLQMQRLYAAWFRCFLADDGVACNLFKGATPDMCGVCQENMNWAVLKSKNID